MPSAVALNAAQVVIVPSYPNRVPIHLQANAANSGSLVNPNDGVVLLPWISTMSQNVGANCGPSFVPPNFVSQAAATGRTLLFTGPGYVNFYLVAPQSTPSTALGNTLRIVGIVFKNAAGETGTTDNEALFNMPEWGISLIPIGDPVLSGLNTTLSNYYLTNSGTDPLSAISPAVWTPPVLGSPINTQPVMSLPGASAGIQVYNAFTNPNSLPNWKPAWNFYIVFQWGDGMISMIDPDDEDIPPHE